MNKVILMGRLVDDPEIYDSADGDAIGLAKFRLAVDRRFKKRIDDRFDDMDELDELPFQ